MQTASSQPVIAPAAANPAAHYVDWGAIVAGTFVALAISSVLFAFGSAIGLSLTTLMSASSASIVGLSIAAALWFLWVQVSSFIGGGYIAGRMRRTIGDAKPHEVEMRDGSHGLIVWAVGVVIGVILASWLSAAGVAGLANVAGSAEYHADKLLRSPTSASSGGDTAEIGRILTASVAAPAVDEEDRSYAVREIAARTGLPETEAQTRFDQTVAGLKSQADTARKYGILIAFLTAASLLVSAAAAWWAACAGGRHRNEGVDHSRFSAWR
ncbi:MAG: hypothetical protein ACKVP5_03295 [Aestuariivirga sp.]